MTAVPLTAPAPLRRRPREEPVLRAVPPVAPAPRVVERERLLRRLAAAGPARVALLVAPAGYGKTTLLRSWEARDARPFRWLDAAAWPATPAEAARLFSRGPRVVVVDGPPGCCAAAARAGALALAAAVPAGSLLVLSVRGAGGLPLARLRLDHDAIDLDARDLAMTHGEAVAVAGASRSDAIGRADGWPALVAAAAYGDAHLPAEYVCEEVLDGLPAPARALLRRLSILDALHPALCAAVSGTQAAGEVLQGLESAGVPVFALERDGGPLRLHGFVREILQAELQRTEPVDARRLHRAAASWFEDRGDTEAALAHAVAASDAQHAGALMWRMAPAYAWDGRASALERRLRELPAGAVEAEPALAGAAALVELVRGRMPFAEHWAQVARAPAGAPGPVSAGVGVLQAIAAGDDAAALAATGASAAAALPAGDPWAPLARWVHGVGAVLAGDDVAGRARLEDGVRAGIVSSPGVAALCEATLALARLCEADMEQGACLAERARGRIDRMAADEHRMLALVTAVSAFARAHRGRFAEARADVALTRRLLAEPHLLPHWHLALTTLALARAELRLSAIGEGRASLATAAAEAARLSGAAALEGWVAEARRCADAATSAALPAADALTAAELRVLRRLPSHLSFREIGAELYVSANTIKTQAHAIYRKLDATSRSAAVERARLLGLLDAASSPSGDARTPCPA